MLVAIGLQLPAQVPLPDPGGQPVPPPATAPAVPGEPVVPAAPKPPPSPYTLAWTRTVESAAKLDLALSSGFVFTSGEGAPLEARALDTGEIAWVSPSGSWLALGATESMVFGVSGDRLSAMDAATGAVRWSASPVGLDPRMTIGRNRLLIATSDALRLHDPETGAVTWTAGLESPPLTDPAFDDTRVVLGLADGSVTAFDLVTGTRQWDIDAGAPPSSVIASGPKVYFALPDGTVCAVRSRDGQLPPAWCARTRIRVAGDLFADDRYLYLALLDNSLRALDRDSGAIRRVDKLGHRPASGPMLSGPSLAIPLSTGEFLLLDREGRLVTRLSSGPSQSFEQAAVRADGGALVTLNILVGGSRSLHGYLPTPAPPPDAAPSDPTQPGTSQPAATSPPAAGSPPPTAPPATPPAARP